MSRQFHQQLVGSVRGTVESHAAIVDADAAVKTTEASAVWFNTATHKESTDENACRARANRHQARGAGQVPSDPTRQLAQRAAQAATGSLRSRPRVAPPVAGSSNAESPWSEQDQGLDREGSTLPSPARHRRTLDPGKTPPGVSGVRREKGTLASKRLVALNRLLPKRPMCSRVIQLSMRPIESSFPRQRQGG